MLRYARLLLLIPLAAFPLGCARRSGSAGAGTEAGSASAAVAWSYDYEAAVTQAEAEGKPLMVDVFAARCTWCKHLDDTVFSRADVGEASRGFICVKVDGGERPDIRDKLGVGGYPTIVFLAPDGAEIGRVRGAVPYQVMLDEMSAAQQKAGPPPAGSG